MIRKAHLEDAKKIQELVNYYAKKDLMLPRSLTEIYESIRDFFVYEEEDRVYGCCALHISWERLAEIKSLAVSPKKKNKGIGDSLVRAAIREARELGIKEIFALTYVPQFFKRFGFKKVSKKKLPHKIWTECVACFKFPKCDEVPLMVKL